MKPQEYSCHRDFHIFAVRRMNELHPIVLASAYFGPVQYFSRVAGGQPVVIEQHDNYSKQTFRNRCEIMGANGRLGLSIPVKKVTGKKTPVKDIKIDYDINWQKNHLKGIQSAYSSSPFFEFYFDDYLWVFESKTNYLIDLNTRILDLLICQLRIEKTIKLSDHFYHISSECDFREIIHPKSDLNHDQYFQPVPYTQVFSDRYGFMENLSVIDLLFNTGNESIGILKRSLTKIAQD